MVAGVLRMSIKKRYPLRKGKFSLRQGDESGVEHLLQRQQHAKLGVVPGETALIVDGVGLAHGTVGGELNGAALHECARRHDDVGVVAGHRRGDRVDIAVDRGGGLDALAGEPSSTHWMMSWRASFDDGTTVKPSFS